MNRTRPLSVLPFLTLIVALGACGPKQQPEEPLPPASSMEPEPAEPGPAEPVEVSDWTAPDGPEVEPLSATELQRMAADFNRQGALRTIFFKTDKAKLLPEARQILAANAAWLRDHPEFAVLVAGHCDERNTEEYNLALGERRAEAVRRYLLSLGVTETRIETISYGEERPLDPGRGESAWAKNRRTEFEVKPLNCAAQLLRRSDFIGSKT